MTNLMLSWQQAALLALGCGMAGVALLSAGHAARAWRWGTHIGPFLREAGVVVGLYALWQLAGNLATGGFDGAVRHAWWVWNTERTLRLPSELAVQGLLLPHPLLSEIANFYYATMHFGMLIAMLIWLFARHRDAYPAVRNAMAVSTAICLVISFIPVAPPRLLPGAGIVDLAARYGESVYAVVGSTAGADQLSAMPSVHVAWSILVAWAVITKARSRWRWLILLHPAAMVFVVVATGNHYWADGIVAAAIDASVITVTSLLAHRRRLRLLARVPRQASESALPLTASPSQSSSAVTKVPVSARLDGVDNRVAEVRTQSGVESPTARDEAQLRVGGRAVNGQRGEAVLGVLADARHPEDRERPVRTSYVYAVTGAERRQPEKDPGASTGVNVPRDNRRPDGTGTRATRVPAGDRCRRGDLKGAGSGQPEVDESGLHAD